MCVCVLIAECYGDLNKYFTVLHLTTYLIRVLTFDTSISYSFLTACFICGLFALRLTTNTSVLLSSIFFIADSVVRGCLMMV